MSDAGLLALRATGWSAALLLAAALASTPLSRLPPLRALARARRRLGIAASTLALGHATLALVVYLPRDVWDTLTHVTWLRSGALALALLVALLVTSFPRVVTALRVAHWKPLHRLAYVAAALVVHHLALAPFAPRAWVLALAAVLATSLVARLSGRRRDAPSRASDDAPQ